MAERVYTGMIQEGYQDQFENGNVATYRNCGTSYFQLIVHSSQLEYI